MKGGDALALVGGAVHARHLHAAERQGKGVEDDMESDEGGGTPLRKPSSGSGPYKLTQKPPETELPAATEALKSTPSTVYCVPLWETMLKFQWE